LQVIGWEDLSAFLAAFGIHYIILEAGIYVSKIRKFLILLDIQSILR